MLTLRVARAVMHTAAAILPRSVHAPVALRLFGSASVRQQLASTSSVRLLHSHTRMLAAEGEQAPAGLSDSINAPAPSGGEETPAKEAQPEPAQAATVVEAREAALAALKQARSSQSEPRVKSRRARRSSAVAKGDGNTVTSSEPSAKRAPENLSPLRILSTRMRAGSPQVTKQLADARKLYETTVDKQEDDHASMLWALLKAGQMDEMRALSAKLLSERTPDVGSRVMTAAFAGLRASLQQARQAAPADAKAADVPEVANLIAAAEKLWATASGNPEHFLHHSLVQTALTAFGGDVARQFKLLEEALQMESKLKLKDPTRVLITSEAIGEVIRSAANSENPSQWEAQVNRFNNLMFKRAERADDEQKPLLKVSNSPRASFAKFTARVRGEPEPAAEDESAAQAKPQQPARAASASKTQPAPERVSSEPAGIRGSSTSATRQRSQSGVGSAASASPTALAPIRNLSDLVSRLSALVPSGSIELARRLCEEAQCAGVALDASALRVWLLVCRANGEWREAERIWSLMPLMGLAPTSATYAALAEAYIASGAGLNSAVAVGQLESKLDSLLTSMRSGSGWLGVGNHAPLRFTSAELESLKQHARGLKTGLASGRFAALASEVTDSTAKDSAATSAAASLTGRAAGRSSRRAEKRNSAAIAKTPRKEQTSSVNGQETRRSRRASAAAAGYVPERSASSARAATASATPSLTTAHSPSAASMLVDAPPSDSAPAVAEEAPTPAPAAISESTQAEVADAKSAETAATNTHN